MFAWISDHMATILICFGLICMITAIIVSMVKDKKKGKSSCCGCQGCSMSDSCHKH